MPQSEHEQYSLLQAPTFNKERHIQYWLRCLKTLLPRGYMPYDANRMMLAAFIVSALDLLSVLDERTTLEERQGYVDWIYSCQHPDGGFRAFNGTDTSISRESDLAASPKEHNKWDPANVAGTFFALSALLVLGDDLGRVRRKDALCWLHSLQLSDGSFAEVGNAAGPLGDGQDVRFCYLAVLARRILRYEELDQDLPDLDTERLVRFMLASQGYDGGFAKAPYHETHAGWTYCAVSALSLLGKLNTMCTAESVQATSCLSEDARTNLLRWLASRQVNLLDEHDDLDEVDSNEEHSAEADMPNAKEHGFSFQRSVPSDQAESAETHESLIVGENDCLWAGFNGRCNKPSDTCYSFWVGGALAVLGQLDFVSAAANRRYLLDKTQHLIGGFGKMPGEPPDVLHSYLGLAALSLMGETGLKSLDPTLCISKEASCRLERLAWKS